MISESVVVRVPGVPPSWPNVRAHHLTLHRRRTVWKRLAWTLAHSARASAGWPITDEPVRRWVRVEVDRRRLLDDDNLVASIKPILDGLKRVLIYDDSPLWCTLFSVRQRQVFNTVEQVVVTVYRTKPQEDSHVIETEIIDSRLWLTPQVDDVLIYRDGHRRLVTAVDHAFVTYEFSNINGHKRRVRCLAETWCLTCRTEVSRGGSYHRPRDTK